MNLESKTKKELIEIIRQLKDKLIEVKDVEKQVTASKDSLTGKGMSLSFDDNKGYQLVLLGYSLNDNAANINEIVDIGTKDMDVAIFHAKKYLAEKIWNKEQMTILSKGGKI